MQGGNGGGVAPAAAPVPDAIGGEHEGAGGRGGGPRPPVVHVHDHATARLALTHPGLTRTALRRCPARPLEGHLLNTDGTQHRRLRAAAADAVEACLPHTLGVVRPLARRLLAELDGEVDVAARVVRPFSLALVGELLGLADDGPALHGWHSAVAAVERHPVPHVLGAVEAQVLAVVEARRDAPRHDVVSMLVADDRVHDDEIAAALFFLLSAGYVNTANFLGLVMKALAGAPAEWDWLRAHPDRVPDATEELLRFCEPTGRASVRVAAQPVTLAGTPVERGTTVWVHRSSAGRDPQLWPDGDRLDLGRPTAQRSLAFGVGPHYCLGASLVRSTTDLLLLTLAEHVEALRPTPRTPPTWDVMEPLPLDVRPAAHPPGRSTDPTS